jgi:hypothetical protein
MKSNGSDNCIFEKSILHDILGSTTGKQTTTGQDHY